MIAVRLCLAAGMAALALSACRSSQPRVPAAAPVARAAPAPGSDPGSHYRRQLLAEAMRGLRYDSGRVELDEAAAGRVGVRGDVDRALVEYQRGQELLRRNQRIQAIGAFTRAVLLAPRQALLYQGLGEALLAQQQAAPAIAAFRTALDLDPGSAAARLELARALEATGQLPAAVGELQEVVGAQPANVEAHRRLAILLYYLQDDAAAWRHVRRVEALGAAVPPQFRQLLGRRTPEPSE